MNRQSRLDAWYWMLGASALGWPRGMVWGGRWKEGSGWEIHVYLWQIHFYIWQNQYNIVKLKKKKDCFGYSGNFVFPYEIWDFFSSSSVKNLIGNLIGIALNLLIAFDCIVIFTILIFPTQEHGISLHMLMLSLICFISVL